MKSNLQNTKYQIQNTNRGITLVALIITVIVLLILAMVSIRLIMNGGIINRAERGTTAYTEAEIIKETGVIKRCRFFFLLCYDIKNNFQTRMREY